ncbi:MAG: sigma-70 family RNA polymerase sigma factor [Lachnospiraceae bacterium]|nr:sigma-70 family RNA polymerase sigma factor [Lachnospiraceae bacterium]
MQARGSRAWQDERKNGTTLCGGARGRRSRQVLGRAQTNTGEVSAPALEELSDEALIRRLRAGDGAVTDVLLNRHKAMVKSKAQTMFLLGGETEDLIQEGMLGLFQALQSYDESREASFRTFAELCVTRKMYNAIESAGSRKNAPLNDYISVYETFGEAEGPEFGDTLPDTAETPEERAVGRETAERLSSMIRERLTPMERRVMGLYVTGMGSGEIAGLLEESPKTVDNALQRAKSKLRRGLES